MVRYVIDGLFLTQRVTGIQRYAIEMVKNIDLLVKQDEFELLVPDDIDPQITLKNIPIRHFGKHRGIIWEQCDLPRYLRSKSVPGIFFCNALPLRWPRGIVAIHDVCYKAHPEFIIGLRSSLSFTWYNMMYKRAAGSDMKIITVSQFSKEELIKYYNIQSERINVINSAWQHINEVEEAKNIFESYPELKNQRYYFSMASIMPNKNYRWIMNAAKNNPESIFAIAGGNKVKAMIENEGFSECKNIRYLGYVSDAEAKALMRNCKAFIYPSLYEGFGLPPLEAVACGCRTIVLSDIPVFREIYGDKAVYIDPYGIDFDSKYDESDGANNVELLLDDYSWSSSARLLYEIIR